ncbi:MAG: MFS transporter [Bacteroidales bacterium]|nr:MFS transporter [Bacteroidales bacterium]MCF8349672.1 MFS transporter [Bacteroidales bacterium]MCF8374918.1 MFS transporter [Bacteroidales bacterium]MCF8400103.1 MFS transporter [Bacteroidales bacterium]
MKKEGKALYLNRNLQVIFAITLVAVMGVASVTPAFPKIKEYFQLNAQQVGYLIMYFTIPGIFLAPFLGMFADRFGRKTIIVPSLFLFALAGFACGLSRNFDLLILFRFLQGTGAAALGSLNLTLIGDLYEGRQRSTAMGYNASVLSIGTASYPAIGGGLAMLGWYYPFFLPLLALPVGFFVLFYLKNPEPRNKQNFREYLKKTYTYLQQRRVLGLMLLNILTFIILYGSFLTYVPLALADKVNAEAWQIGIVLSFASIATAVTSSQLGRLSSTHGDKSMLISAYVLYIITLIIIPLLDHIWLFLIPSAIYGIGQGLNFPTIQSMLAGSAPIEVRAAFLSVNGMVLRGGQTLGPWLIGLVYVAFGMSWAFFAGAIFAVLMILVVLTMIR